jgi:[acyl-carrier-protein] S-malonyltransferase
MAEVKAEIICELGPGTALSGFMKRIDKTATMLNVADAASLEATVKALSV